MTDATESQPGPRARPAIFWIFLAVFAAGMFVYVKLATSPASGPGGTQGPAIGRHLEYLQLEGLTGGAGSVSLDDLSGRVTLVNFWGTWCPPCIREFPDIVELHQQFAEADDFRLYAVSCGEGIDATLDPLRDETQTFLASRQVELPTYADPNGESRRAMIAMLGEQGMAYPTTLIVDRQGAIRYFIQRYDPGAAREMADVITKLLAQPAAAKAAD